VSTVGLSKDGFTLKGGISGGFFPLKFFFAWQKMWVFFGWEILFLNQKKPASKTPPKMWVFFGFSPSWNSFLSHGWIHAISNMPSPRHFSQGPVNYLMSG
jgi:hypothetical protein